MQTQGQQLMPDNPSASMQTQILHGMLDPI